MTIAGAAMCLATGAVFVATRFSRNQLSGVYVTIIVVGYMLKDRMKEWGKRYLQPAAMKFGFEFPDRTVKVRIPKLRVLLLSWPKESVSMPCAPHPIVCCINLPQHVAGQKYDGRWHAILLVCWLYFHLVTPAVAQLLMCILLLMFHFAIWQLCPFSETNIGSCHLLAKLAVT